MDANTFPAGPELDALICEKVMGHTICEHSRGSRPTAQSGGFAMCGVPECTGERHYQFLPRYSADMAAAWEVVEKILVILVIEKAKDTYLPVFSVQAAPHGYSAVLKVGMGCERVSVNAGTAPLAICRAALKATSGGK